MEHAASMLDEIAGRAGSLFSRPSVAIEVMKLMEAPQPDGGAIRACLERDPALTCKILRVVNSSLFGLRVSVSDLSQALALLGTKPLRLLVLGFSLPDALFADVAGKQLQWYWTGALTRAVAARLLSEQLWRQPADEAFTAALLEDIGILVLLRALGQPYAKFLGGVIKERRDLAALERETLGFDHTQLSAKLLVDWRLPERLVAAVAAPKETAALARLKSPEADLPQILYLSQLVVELVGQRRLHLLVDLLEAGEAFHALTKAKLTELVDQLQPQVDQLAAGLSVELLDGRDYVQVLVEAHERLAWLAEEFAAAAPTGSSDSVADVRTMDEGRQLSDAMHRFLGNGSPREANVPPCDGWGMKPDTYRPERGGTAVSVMGLAARQNMMSFLQELSGAARRCRQRRQELSLLLLEANGINDVPDATAAGRLIRQALRLAATVVDESDVTLLEIDSRRTAAILSNCERRAAVSIAHHTIANLNTFSGGGAQGSWDPATILAVGVATAGGIAKNFDPAHLWESAERCLAAACLSGISSVKSIEV